MKALMILFLVVCSSLAAEMKILAFSGSTRTDSYNKKLINEAALIAKSLGATVTVIDLKDYPMPFYDGDLEKKGMPANAKKFRNLMLASDGIIISTPEYNASISAVLKNAIDWASRNEQGKGSMEAFEGKKFALMSVSGAGQGNALVHLSEIITGEGGEVLPEQVVTTSDSFNQKGQLSNPEIKEKLQQEIKALVGPLADSQ